MNRFQTRFSYFKNPICFLYLFLTKKIFQRLKNRGFRAVKSKMHSLAAKVFRRRKAGAFFLPRKSSQIMRNQIGKTSIMNSLKWKRKFRSEFTRFWKKWKNNGNVLGDLQRRNELQHKLYLNRKAPYKDWNENYWKFWVILSWYKLENTLICLRARRKAAQMCHFRLIFSRFFLICKAIIKTAEKY